MFELRILFSARPEPSTLKHKNPNADKKQDYLKVEKVETISDQRNFLRFKEPGTLIRAPSAYAEDLTDEHYDADNEQDYIKDEEYEPIDHLRVSPRLDQYGTPISAPSTHAAEKRTQTQTQTPAPLTLKPEPRPAEATYVRALRSSEAGTKPRFDKGDILRVIGEGTEVEEGSLSIEVLPLRPPSESGRALREFFEKVEREAVFEILGRARTKEERAAFFRAVAWGGVL